MARRTSIENSSRPGATGKYWKRPRWRLPASGSRRSLSWDIAQRFLSQHLHHRDLKRRRLVRPFGGQALELDGEPRHVDAVARRKPLVGGVGRLQEIRHVLQEIGRASCRERG